MAGGIRVLYVDDEPDLLELTRLFLEETGNFQVTTSISAETALEMQEFPAFDVIISDFLMPGMDGIVFLKEVRHRYGDIPFILFTGRGREEIVIEAINNGADFYLQKGGEPHAQYAELAHKIRQAVLRRRSELSRMKAERSLRESEELLRLFIEHAPTALAMFDRGMRYLATSRRWMTDYHLGDRDLRGLSHYEVFPELPEELKAVHRRSLAGETISAEAEKFVRLDGTVQWLAWEVLPWYTAGREIGGIIIFSEDVTKRKNSEEALQGSRRILETIVNTVPARIFWKDTSLTYLGCNTAFARDAGYEKPEEVIGKDDYSMGWREQADRYRADDRLVLESGNARLLIEEPQTTPTGEQITLLTSKVPLKDGEGEIIGVLGVYLDITKQKPDGKTCHAGSGQT
jgi:PAS domain S-box-containing protein